MAEADGFFATNDRHRTERFWDKRHELRSSIEPGLDSTPSLCRWFEKHPDRRWDVLGDDSLSFYYLDRELVSTRAPGERLEGGRSTRLGPRLDLLLANARDGTPIVGELKVTAKRKPRPGDPPGYEQRRAGPDKDPFYGLIQGLASAAYLLPRNQLSRLRRHDPGKRLELRRRRVDVYILVGEEPEASRPWFELRDRAQRLSEAILPGIAGHVRTIACLDLRWYPWRPLRSRLRITKRFAFTARG
ncbi:MAG: hypothetical protein ACRDMH_10590 [Solirubrobacterales bacterium]